MEAMIIFSSVMIILVCSIWITKQLILAVTWIVRNTMKDLYKDLKNLDLGMEEEK